MPLKRAVTEFGKTYKDRFALRTYPGTSVPIFIFILGWSRTKPRVTLSAQTMRRRMGLALGLDIGSLLLSYGISHARKELASSVG